MLTKSMVWLSKSDRFLRTDQQEVTISVELSAVCNVCISVQMSFDSNSLRYLSAASKQIQINPVG